MIYGREALRRLREQQANPRPEAEPSQLEQVRDEAPMPDAVLAVWNGREWVAWESWLATAPLIREGERANRGPTFPTGASCIAADCGGAKIWLVKNGERWQMFIGSRKAEGRRRDFATPYVEHAIRTAEFWFGAPGGGWRAEKGRDGKGREAADLSPQDSTVEEGAGERGHDDLDLGGKEPGR